MRLGICGPHRAGKTTLATYAAEQHDMTLVTSPASQIVKGFGFDMARDNRLSFERQEEAGGLVTGIDMQWAIYDTILQSIVEAQDLGGSIVTDRTPIDVAAYLLADATAYAGNERTQAEAMFMLQRAIVDTEMLFDAVILVPPGIQFVAEDGKPPINEAYQEHHFVLCRGLLLDDDLDVWWDEIRRHTTHLEDRKAFVDGVIAEVRA